MILIAICYSQLAVRYPRAGGEISYAYHMWGIDAAFLCGWFMVFSYVTTITFQAVVLGWMFDVLAPSLRGPMLYTVLETPIYLAPTLLSLVAGVVIVLLNSREVRAMAQFQSWLTFGKILLSVIFFSGALYYGSAENLVPKWSANAIDFSWAGIFAVFATAPFFLAGFDVVPLAMGEKATTTTSRAVHVAVVGSLVAAVTYYALVILSVSAAMPRTELLQSPLPAIAALEHVLGSPFLAKLALIAGLMGVFRRGTPRSMLAHECCMHWGILD
jgi:basic amino acid/polyamine antiporter, APA family